MEPPRKTMDPCYWKEYRLERIASAMRSGRFEEPTLSDSQKVAIAYAMLERVRTEEPSFAVWLNDGKLSVRFGHSGEPVLFAWASAAAFVEFFQKPVEHLPALRFRKPDPRRLRSA